MKETNMLFTTDKLFLPRLFSIVMPILLQNLLNASLNFIDVFMIGQLGETAVAAVGSANQYFFIFIMLMFGLASGAAIFTAQFWGARDMQGIRSFMGIGLFLTLGISVLFTALTLIFPGPILMLFTGDASVISSGIVYLRIIAWMFVPLSVGVTFSVVLRSTENVIYPMAASFIGIALNTVLNYALIFGNFGFPALGVSGAAYATVIARFVEMSIVVAITYGKKLPAAAGITELLRFKALQMKEYLYRSMPVVAQSAGWALGYSTYSMIYGHLSTESLAAFNISGSVERICLMFFTGLGSACAIMVGNRIGAGENEKARSYAASFLTIAMMLALIISVLLLLLRNPIVGLYNFNETSRLYVRGILLVMALIMWAKGANIIFHMGIFKAGGDTLFSMFVDVGGVWLIGVPIAAVAGFIFGMPVHLIVALLTAEEIIKMSVGMARLRSGRWLHNLVQKTAVEA
ncbi:MAG: MATE family efflux transporter [Spirochaetota bacterium]